jgi:hypothetical protein
MRLSLTSIFTLLIILYLVFFLLYGWKVYESFNSTFEGFETTPSDISLTTCPPSEANESQMMKSRVPPGDTNTYCYDGETQKCSLSHDKSKNESCTHYYSAFLRSKATSRCPRSMPNYFQDLRYVNNVDKSVRGCTAGVRTSDGKSPAAGEKQCIIYTNQKDDLEKLDSCTNQKRLESAQCFSSGVAGVTKVLQANNYGSPYVQCSFSQIEKVLKGKKTENVNAEAGAAQQKEIAAQNALNSKWTTARNIVATLATQGPVSVNPPEKGKGITEIKIFKWGNEDNENINLSQLVVRDVNGINIAGKGAITSRTASGAVSEDYGTSVRTLVDGTEAPRRYPRIYHSKNTGNDSVVLTFNSPVDISSITIYNRSDCCNSRITKYGIRLTHSSSSYGRLDMSYVDPHNLKPDHVQTISFIPPISSYSGEIIKEKLVITDIFSPESVSYNCTELQSYVSWIDSIKNLYPDMYASSSYNLRSSETWSDDKKNSFCNILEQTKIKKSMSDTALKAISVL